MPQNCCLFPSENCQFLRLNLIKCHLTWWEWCPILYIAKAPTASSPSAPPTEPTSSTHNPRDLHPKKQADECNKTHSPLQPDLHWIIFLVMFGVFVQIIVARVISYELHNEIHSVAFTRVYISTTLPNAAHRKHLNVSELAQPISRCPNCKLLINSDDSNKWYLIVGPVSTSSNVLKLELKNTCDMLTILGYMVSEVLKHFWIQSPSKDLERILVIW